MPRRPGVYLFDEFDSVAKARGDAHDVGEMNRIVTSFLQLMDADPSQSILIAATNHAELLDRTLDIQARSAERMTQSGEGGISTISASLVFEVPEKKRPVE